MLKQKSLIGQIITDEQVTLEPSRIRWLYETSLIQPDKHSKEPSIRKVALLALGDFDRVLLQVGAKPHSVLLSQEEVSLLKPIQLGDVLQIKTIIKDLYEQQASNHPMGFVHVRIEGHHNNLLAFEGERVLAIRGGFPRGA